MDNPPFWIQQNFTFRHWLPNLLNSSHTFTLWTPATHFLGTSTYNKIGYNENDATISLHTTQHFGTFHTQQNWLQQKWCYNTPTYNRIGYTKCLLLQNGQRQRTQRNFPARINYYLTNVNNKQWRHCKGQPNHHMNNQQFTTKDYFFTWATWCNFEESAPSRATSLQPALVTELYRRPDTSRHF